MLSPNQIYLLFPICGAVCGALLWINFFQDSRVGKCQCCLRETITIGNFNCGHIKAHVNNGPSSLENLVPICTLCNTSMGKYDLKEFIKKYNLHYGL